LYIFAAFLKADRNRIKEFSIQFERITQQQQQSSQEKVIFDNLDQGIILLENGQINFKNEAMVNLISKIEICPDQDFL
jgi:K+-sensing histidine kinase KdpD